VTNDRESSDQYSAVVRQCSFDQGVEEIDAYLIEPGGNYLPLPQTLTVVEQFDLMEAVRTAAASNRYQNADSSTLHR
jgi:hypothetical protein